MNSGLHFIGSSGSGECVFVPWSEIGPMTIERHASGKGGTRTVVLTISIHSSFWDAALESRFLSHILQPEGPPGYRRRPLGNQGMGIRPSRTRAAREGLTSGRP